LGFIAELWKPPEAWAGLDRVVERAERSETRPDNYRLRDATSQRLLQEVVNAARAIMYTVDKIEGLVAEVQEWVDESIEPLGEDEERPQYVRGVGDPRLVAAGWEFANLLTWLRSLQERIERDARKPKGEKVGLVPMLNPHHPITPKVVSLVEDLYSGALGDRLLANLVLHHEVVPRYTGAELTDDNRVIVRIPDRPEGPVDFSFELRYSEERDLISLARAVAEDVRRFVDGLLDEFEEANRMRQRGEIPSH